MPWYIIRIRHAVGGRDQLVVEGHRSARPSCMTDQESRRLRLMGSQHPTDAGGCGPRSSDFIVCWLLSRLAEWLLSACSSMVRLRTGRNWNWSRQCDWHQSNVNRIAGWHMCRRWCAARVHYVRTIAVINASDSPVVVSDQVRPIIDARDASGKPGSN